MPLDFFGGQREDDPYGQGGMGGGLFSGARANSLIGLGMGLLSPTPIGGSAWSQALRGWQSGAQMDEETIARGQRLKMERERMQLAREQANRPPEAIRQLMAAGIPKEKWGEYLYPKMDDWTTGSIKDPDSERDFPYQVHKRTGEIRWLMGAPPGYGGAPGAAPSSTDGSGAVPYVDPSTGAPAPAAAPPTPSSLSSPIPGPGGKPIPVPEGLRPSERKEFRKHILKETATAEIGGGTEAQQKAAGFAARMENAEADLKGFEEQGLSTQQRAIQDYAPSIVGNRLLTPEYQRYTTARSQFITALLRRESGAAVQPFEFNRYDREFFPQPGDNPQVIEQKRRARAVAIEQMRRSSGPGYRSPEAAPIPGPQAAPPPPVGGRTGGAAVPTDPLQQARDAINRGAPRAAVIQRLRENGIDPSGL